MAHFAPFGIVAGRRVRISEGNNICETGFGGVDGAGQIVKGNAGLLLEMLWLDGVAEVGVIFLPADGDC